MLKIVLILLAIIVGILIILIVVGFHGIKRDDKNVLKIEKLIKEEKYVAAKYENLYIFENDREFVIGKWQKARLKKLNHLLKLCNDKIKEKEINEGDEIADYMCSFIPELEGILHPEIDFALKTFSVNLDYKNSDSETPLMIACKNGKTDIAKEIIKHGANLEVENNNKQTALLISCILGDFDIVKLLIDNGANVKHKDNSGKNILKLVNPDTKDYIKIISLLSEKNAHIEE